MTHNELNAYIHHYLTEDKTHSAIMLTAPWGTGKSYYIQNELVPFLADEKNGSHKCIVVSLYGLKDLYDLSKALYLGSRFEFLTNTKEAPTTSRFVAKTVVKGVTSFFGVDLSQSEEDMKKLYESVNLSGKLIILEDLERTDIGILKVLGYVNNLVEQDCVKVLLIANEEEIIEYKPIEVENAEEEEKVEFYDRVLNHKGRVLTETTKEYLKTKEKTVSDTIQFESNLSIAIKEIIASFHNTYLDRFATGTEQTGLYGFCVNNEIVNLRTFVFACQKTVDILGVIRPDANEDEDFVKTLFYGVIAFSQRLKAGRKISWNTGEFFSSELATEDYPLFRFCFDYITEHSFNTGVVEASKKALYEYRKYDKNKSLSDADLCVLYNWWVRTEKDLMAAICSITQRLENEDDISFFEYGRLAKNLVSVKHYIGCNIDRAKQLLIKNLHNKNNRIKADYIFTTIFGPNENPEVVKEYSQLKIDMTASLEAMGGTVFGFDYQPKSIPEFSRKVDAMKGFITGNGAFASRFDMDKAFEMLKKCTAEEINDFRLTFYRVYEPSNISAFLCNDKTPLEELLEKVESLLDYSEFDRVQKFQIELFIENLTESLKRYS